MYLRSPVEVSIDRETILPPREDSTGTRVLTAEKADVVIKAQVLAGGRGMGTFTNGFQGGVHVVTR